MRTGESAGAEEIRDGVIRVNGCLEKCVECGKVASQIIHHSCEDETRSGRWKRSEERSQMAEDDPRPKDVPVLVLYHGTNSGAYAYHEVDHEENPVCGGGYADKNQYSKKARKEAQREGRSPCQNCQRIIQKGE